MFSPFRPLAVALAAFCALADRRSVNADAYYILRGTALDFVLRPADDAAVYSELPIRLARRSIVSDFAGQPLTVDEPPPELMLLGASNFVPSLTPVDAVEEDQIQDQIQDKIQDEDNDDTTPTTYLLVPQRVLDTQRAKRAVIDAQTDALASILEGAREERRQKLEDAQREAELIDKVEYENRAEQLRQALMGRRPERPATALTVDDEGGKAGDEPPSTLERILLPAGTAGNRPKRVADGLEGKPAVRLPVDPATVGDYDGAAAVATALFGDGSDVRREEEDELPFVILT